MESVNSQCDERHGFSGKESNGKAEHGQFVDRNHSSEVCANDGEAVPAPSYSSSSDVVGSPNDGELEGASSPSFGIVKGTDSPKAPALEKGQPDVKGPDSVKLGR